jgi:hypothetical protein
MIKNYFNNIAIVTPTNPSIQEIIPPYCCIHATFLALPLAISCLTYHSSSLVAYVRLQFSMNLSNLPSTQSTFFSILSAVAIRTFLVNSKSFSKEAIFSHWVGVIVH